MPDALLTFFLDKKFHKKQKQNNWFLEYVCS